MASRYGSYREASDEPIAPAIWEWVGFGSRRLYDNGPINGNVDAWTINFGFVMSDPFTLLNNSAPSAASTSGLGNSSR